MSSTLYTLQDVSIQNGKNGALVWIVIKDYVYDVTNYLEDHPGGAELLSEYAGSDATKMFEDFGHSGDARNILKKFKIGELVEDDKKSNRKNNTKNISKESAYTEIRKKRKGLFFLFC